MTDRVEEETNKMLEDDDIRNKALDFFQNDIKEILEDMKNDISFMKKLAKDYKGYNLSEDLEDMIKEII